MISKGKIKMEKKLLILSLILFCSVNAQTYKVEKVKGTVKVQVGSSETWLDVSEGIILQSNSIISTNKNSLVQLNSAGNLFVLKESSALPLSSIKKMTLDELLLALAMEDMINVPKKKEDTKSKSTATYGTKEEKKNLKIESDDFGIMKLNGAIQLAENGFKESAVVVAKETYRKYPGTKNLAADRIYFANILYDKGLYEEAYEEFDSIKDLRLTDQERVEVENKSALLSKKLINK